MKHCLTFALLVALAAVPTNSVKADEAAANATPSIRNFDVAMIEKLGRAMYEQDQLAWKATDIAVAHFTEDGMRAQKVHGWIVEPAPNGNVIRFIHDTPDGPQLFYDVAFAVDGSTHESLPEIATLSTDEKAQYDARQLALANTSLKCSNNYNTVVLKDPEHEGWLVWVMAATKDPTIAVIGGHTRFSISVNGGTITQADPLSRSCMNIPLYDHGNKTADMLTTQIVSLTPVETHVFASLAYKIPLYVGTNDGIAWKVSDGVVTQVDMDAPDPDGFAARQFAGQAEVCKTIVTKDGETPAKYYIQDGSPVISQTEKSRIFFVEAKPDFKTASLMCVRQDIVPAPNDWKVLAAGYSLLISDNGAGHSKRLGSLEIKGGQLLFRIAKGDPLTPALEARINKRLDQMQTAYQDQH